MKAMQMLETPHEEREMVQTHVGAAIEFDLAISFHLPEREDGALIGHECGRVFFPATQKRPAEAFLKESKCLLQV